MTETEHIRFQSLRQRELAGDNLTAKESRELAHYIVVVESEESISLQSSRDEREAHIAILDEKVARMRSLVTRREALAEYLRRVAQEVDTEREAIDTAFRQLIVTAEPSTKNLAGVAQ